MGKEGVREHVLTQRCPLQVCIVCQSANMVFSVLSHAIQIWNVVSSVYTMSDGGNFLSLMYVHLLTCTLCCRVAGDSVPDVGSSSLLYYQTSLVEVPDHVVYLLCHHSIHLLPCNSQAAGLHHTKVLPSFKLYPTLYFKRSYFPLKRIELSTTYFDTFWQIPFSLPSVGWCINGSSSSTRSAMPQE